MKEYLMAVHHWPYPPILSYSLLCISVFMNRIRSIKIFLSILKLLPEQITQIFHSSAFNLQNEGVG